MCIEARDGALTGLLQKELVKSTPSSANLSRFGDDTYPRALSLLPVVARFQHAKASALWSSVMTQRMLGFTISAAVATVGSAATQRV